MLGLALIAPELITITITDKWQASVRILLAMRLGSRYPYQQPIFEHDYQPGTVPSLHVEYGCTRHSPDIGPHIHEPLRHLRHAGHLYDNQCHVAGNMERLCTKKHRTPIFRDAERPVAIPHGSNRNNNGDLRVDPNIANPYMSLACKTALAVLLLCNHHVGRKIGYF